VAATVFELRQAFDWLPDAVLLGTGTEAVSAVSTDTRRLKAGDLFVALRGDNFDAHDFIATAQEGGAAAIVVERWTGPMRPPALLVPDSRKALGWIAAGWRRRFELPLIAVTGSNGKTTVKEMIASILAEAVGPAAAFATRGNLNNDVGVPLTLLALASHHRAAVVEVGMNHVGEIGWLAGLVRPTVALVNNAQREHQEFLSGPEATAVENGAILAALDAQGIAVFPGDDAHADIWRSLAGKRRTIEFGLTTAQAVHAEPGSRPVRFTASIEGSRLEIELNIAGRHNVRNALAAAACAHAIGIAPEVIARGLKAFEPVTGRLRRLNAAGGFELIDDSYNANPDSVRAAIDVLADEPSPRLLVLGDMAEVGTQGPAFHREVGAYARERGIDQLLGAGEMSKETVAAFGSGAVHFESVTGLAGSLAQWLHEQAANSGDTPARGSVLVKGSRSMRMERVVHAIAHPSNTPGVEAH
jgi:UDP-N-acetylmuramoyl-tripeptide--D-alanyl-D-alanine ligase